MRQRMLLILTPILMMFSIGCLFIQGGGARHTISHTVEPAINIKTGGNNGAYASNLLVIWSSDNREVAMQTCMTYLERAVENKWFNGTTLIIWGPSAKLLANDKELQARIELLIDMGAKVLASAESASSYGVTKNLKELGIEVQPMEAPFSDVIRSANTRVITF